MLNNNQLVKLPAVPKLMTNLKPDNIHVVSSLIQNINFMA